MRQTHSKDATASPLPPDRPPTQQFYARFSRRLQAMMIDSMLFTLLVFGGLLLSTATSLEWPGRVIGFSILATLLLYEPVLVSMRGATIGHANRNLRVVDQTTGRSVGFGRACARAALKLVLGVFSFATMLLTARHQAFHDVLTHSIVRIDRVESANRQHYVQERIPVRVSRVRRIGVILIYELVSFILFYAVLVGLNVAGLISPRCIIQNFCTSFELVIQTALSLTWMGLAFALLVWGWRGRLVGARA